MSEDTPSRPIDRRGFRVGIICALTVEADMVEMVFDKDWTDDIDYGKAPGDPNTYTAGVIAGYNIILTYCSGAGSNSAAHAALGLRSSFTGIKIVFVVGICGVTPSNSETEQPIMLGDCIISTSVIQYDMGHHGPNGFQRKTGSDNLGRADVETRSRITKLKTRKNTLKLEADIASHLQQLQQADPDRSQYPGIQEDQLFDASYTHQHHPQVENCDRCNVELGICRKDCIQLGCDGKYLVQRSVSRNNTLPRIHFGCYGSANTVLKSGLDRDKLANTDGFIAFEMEASGVWDIYPTMLIKAACDYADSHKNKKWQTYSAAVAAAGLKAFLQQLKLPDEEPPPTMFPVAKSQQAAMTKHTALVYLKAKKFAEAEPLWRRLYEMSETSNGLHHVETRDCLYYLGCCYLSQCETSPSKAPLALETLEKCYTLRKEALGVEHRFVITMGLDLGLAYKANNQLSDAEQILSFTLEKIIAAHPTILLAHVRNVITRLGEVQWALELHDKGKSTYRRLAVMSLLDGRFPGDRDILVRAGVDSPSIQQYMAIYCIAPMNPATGQFNYRGGANMRCDGCRQTTDMHLGYHHCLACWNVDFCKTCFRLLQANQPTSPACNKDHPFMEIVQQFWFRKSSPFNIVDRQGMVVGSWLESFRRGLIEKIKTEEIAWMQWLEGARGGSNTLK